MIYNVKTEENFRGCGIGKVLTALCLMDPRVYSLTQSKALSSSSEWSHANADFLKQCNRLVGLNMSAKDKRQPLSGGFAYINAAHYTGYHYFVVHVFDSGKD